ncbi:MAG TPA: hypothetical protein VI874_03690 [Candidatus Norongarragalinales archaeon]|nr:hypothetical protein [Candidatus Norongarragalinales archaeon]
MLVAVLGRSTPPFSRPLLSKAETLGKLLALKGHVVSSGACAGLPHAAIRQAFQQGGKTVGYSPGQDVRHHVERFDSPTDSFSQLKFFGNKNWSQVLNLSWRSAHLIDDADALVCIEGSWGTVSEIAQGFWTEKPFGILESGGASAFVKRMEKTLAPRRVAHVVYSKKPETLIQRLTG